MKAAAVLTMAWAATLVLCGTAWAGGGDLELYSATFDRATESRLVAEGYDVVSRRDTTDGVVVEIVLAKKERGKLAREGVKLRVVRDRQGRSQSERAALQASGGHNVFRSFDEPGGIRDELYDVARDNPQLVKLDVLGRSHQGREYIALKLTQGARGIADGKRPAVLYVATHHAREWISTEVARRLLHHYIDRWRANDPEVRRLLKDTELWFVLVHNPDGYEYSFDAERLWRKNLRDNDANGTIDANDGVDPNRNYPEHWNFDDEGSSGQFSSATYRGPAAASEPETRALMRLFDRVPFLFTISYHSFGELLLYTQGWQVQTPSADDPIYVALTGTDDDPAVPGYDPGVGADLYTTNGDFNDWSHGVKRALSWTPELAEGCDGCGFVFPDDEALIQAEFERNLPFALNVARSAQDPDDPVSHAGVDTAPFYLDVSSIDRYKRHNPLSDLAVTLSYAGGSAQAVDVLAKRSLGDVTLRYRINGGAVQSGPTSEAPEGKRFGGSNAYDVHYHYLRGTIPGLAVGDSVEYWFEGAGEASERTSFDVDGDARPRVLVVAAEDRTGASTLPSYASTSPATPNHLAYYTAALAANGVDYEVYDVDARGRRAPDQLGVLSHYDAVVWYTGNDLVTREPGWSAGNASRLANDMMLEMRAHLNAGGRLLYTGQWAGAVENGVAGTQLYDPVANERCVVGGVAVLERCQVISDKDDFLQYWLGAYLYDSDGGTDPATGEPYDIEGVAAPFAGLNWGLNGPAGASAGNQIHTANLLTTSSLLKPDVYPQFASSAPARWVTGGAGGFEPVDGDWYVYSGRDNVSYKRLTRTVDLTGVSAADAPALQFKASYDTEPDWDFLFVEADAGGGDRTTLPDSNGHTSTDVGSSCPEGWFDLHPWLEHYQGPDCSGANWNATSGRSTGWEQWSIDLSDYAGRVVELSISYVSDWSLQGLGAFVDDVVLTHGGGSTSFEDGLGGWTMPGAPEGSDPNAGDWRRTRSVGYEDGAAVKTADTLMFGFGLEGVAGADARRDIMGRALSHLLAGAP